MYICVKGAQLMDKSVEKWISSKEAAEYMGINKDMLQRWITNNQIPCHRVGRLWKFKISEIKEHVLKADAKEMYEIVE